MNRDQMLDTLERAAWTAVQAGVAAWAVGAGWKAAAAAGIGAGLSVVKQIGRTQVAKGKSS